MKRNIKFFVIFLLTLIVLPIDVQAITLGEYEAKVRKYKSDYEKAQKSVKLTEQQIQSTKNEINRIINENIKLEEEIENLIEEIEKGKEEIKEKSLQTKEFFAYLQVANGENAYLEYAFGADNITDFIYRMSIVQQMTEYNQDITKELKEMIDRNNKREEEIKKKRKELAERKVSLEKKVSSLGEEKNVYEENGIDAKKQLKIYEELVASYKKLGCKTSDVLGVDCAVSGPAGIFRRPTTHGYITSEFGNRWGKVHRGLDITSRYGKNEKIYPVANGTVISKYTDYYGALVITLEHYDSTKKIWYTSTYAHLSSYAPNMYVGKYVTSEQHIGNMGNTGYVLPRPTASNPNAGTHLHFELIPCRMFRDNKCGTWSSYYSYVTKLVKNGYKGPRSVINFPRGSWNSR